METMRFQWFLNKSLNISPKSYRRIRFGGAWRQPCACLERVAYCRCSPYLQLRKDNPLASKKSLKEIESEVAKAGWEIYNRKGTTWYGIAGAVGRIVRAITDDAKVVLPLSALSGGIYCLPDLHIGLPALVGKEGIEKVWKIPLDEGEHATLLASGKLINEYKNKIL